ncbi:MAG: glutamate-cysteine ligase family protein [Planctomycetaceae bacterium]
MPHRSSRTADRYRATASQEDSHHVRILFMSQYPLFSVYGVELEYMIVDSNSLGVRPIADELLRSFAGSVVSDVERGDIALSNELALHVIELKTNGPRDHLSGLSTRFEEEIAAVNESLGKINARLMPTAMHPWMDPSRELRLWPHDYGPVYEAFHRIFDCRGHGWANLQSVHLNLPFSGDAEFGRLHAAVRLVLPLLPALAASSPAMDGKLTGLMDNRLEVYRTNTRRIASVTGRVIPEPVYTEADYGREIFQPMTLDVARHDPAGVLQHEFLNARGAIARFSRGSIEIRVLDVQDCPQADVAICALIVHLLKQLVAERWTRTSEQQAVPIDPLEKLFLGTIRDADQATIDDGEYLNHFGLRDMAGSTAAEVWRVLIDDACDRDDSFRDEWGPALQVIAEHGPVARRIVRQLGEKPSLERLRQVYGQLCDCLG